MDEQRVAGGIGSEQDGLAELVRMVGHKQTIVSNHLPFEFVRYDRAASDARKHVERADRQEWQFQRANGRAVG